MTIEETKEVLDKCYDLKETVDEIEGLERFVQNGRDCDISVHVDFDFGDYHAYNSVVEKYQKMLEKVCFSVLKANVENDLAELKKKLSKADVKIETED